MQEADIHPAAIRIRSQLVAVCGRESLTQGDVGTVHAPRYGIAALFQNVSRFLAGVDIPIGGHFNAVATIRSDGVLDFYSGHIGNGCHSVIRISHHLREAIHTEVQRVVLGLLTLVCNIFNNFDIAVILVMYNANGRSFLHAETAGNCNLNVNRAARGGFNLLSVQHKADIQAEQRGHGGSIRFRILRTVGRFNRFRIVRRWRTFCSRDGLFQLIGGGYFIHLLYDKLRAIGNVRACVIRDRHRVFITSSAQRLLSSFVQFNRHLAVAYDSAVI